MLDYSKITFNEIDDTDRPLEVFYNYDLTQTEIEKLVRKYATEDDVPKGVRLCNIELMLSIYSKNDFKLEAVGNDDDGEQYWIELEQQSRNEDELLQLIPEHVKMKYHI